MSVVEEFLLRNVKSDATHVGTKPPFEYSTWLIINGCKKKYFWLDGEWVESEIQDPISCFRLKAIKK